MALETAGSLTEDRIFMVWTARERALDVANRIQKKLGGLFAALLFCETACILTIMVEIMDEGTWNGLTGSRTVISFILYVVGLKMVFSALHSVSIEEHRASEVLEELRSKLRLTSAKSGGKLGIVKLLDQMAEVSFTKRTMHLHILGIGTLTHGTVLSLIGLNFAYFCFMWEQKDRRLELARKE